jgi:chromosome segregation ATPase
VDRRAALDRSQLQNGLGILDSLSGNVQALSGRLVGLSEEARTAHGNYQDAIGRLRDGEQRLAASESRLNQVDEGLCWALASQEEIRTKMEAQEAATASLGQAVRNQTELIEAQVMPNLARLNERLESIAQTLQTHSDVLDRLSAAWSSTQAVQQSLQGGLDRQAEVIDAVRLTTKAQVEMWGQLLKVATEFTQTTDVPAEGTTQSV